MYVEGGFINVRSEWQCAGQRILRRKRKNSTYSTRRKEKKIKNSRGGKRSRTRESSCTPLRPATYALTHLNPRAYSLLFLKRSLFRPLLDIFLLNHLSL